VLKAGRRHGRVRGSDAAAPDVPPDGPEPPPEAPQPPQGGG
jgi:hypothetical protein